MSDLTAEKHYNDLARMVPVIARRVKQRCPKSIELKDLEQTGRMALWRACRKLDAPRAARFPTYARMRICGAMLDSIRGKEFSEAKMERDAVRIDGAKFRPVAKPALISDPFVTRAVEQLGGRQAAVIGLRFYAGLSRAETGRQIGISGPAVGRAERSAIAVLQQLLLPRAA